MGEEFYDLILNDNIGKCSVHIYYTINDGSWFVFWGDSEPVPLGTIFATTGSWKKDQNGWHRCSAKEFIYKLRNGDAKINDIF